MKFPTGDWQFWVTTAAFVAAIAWLARGLVPRLRFRSPSARAKKRRVGLTIEGRPAGRGPRRHGPSAGEPPADQP